MKDKINSIINNSSGEVAVAFKNLNTRETFMINENKIFPSASTIKLVIMATLLNKVHEKKITLEDSITLLNKHKCGGDGILKELSFGHKFTIKEIMTLMIILSDNTATNILIDFLGMNEINAMAKKLKLEDTKLQRKMMDSEASKNNLENLTSAKDLFRFLDLAYDEKIIDKQYSNVIIETLKKQQVKGRLDLYLPEDLSIAHKTGDLDRLEHDVGIIYTKNANYIICVLTNNIENRIGREVIGKISMEIYRDICK